ncbi:MAG: hypothetical protein NTY51_06740 [Deltaproteobacteria bacterium]|jgi:hypothetical protein|nr:hypothetical protein [Deltaproteobacteria bacterium]
MGLALDEPKEGDEHYTVNELPIIVDPFAMKMIKESGGLKIKSSIFGPTAELAGAACGEGCSCS